MSVTTEQLVALAQEAADLTNVADYVTPTTWLSWLNAGKDELHRFVTNKFKATYYRTFDFTLAAGVSQRALPSNFWRLTGLDLDPGTPRRRELRPYNFQDRNRIRMNDVRTFDPLLFATDRFYNAIGSSLIQIQPQENASGNYRLYYTPKPRPLAYVRTITRNNGVDNVTTAGPTWFFTNFGLSFPLVLDVGNLLTIAGATNSINNGTRMITSVTAATTAVTDGVGLTETFPNPATATLATCLDSELEPYAEYVWLTAAIKSLSKEESFAQIRALTEQRNLIRDDLTEALETDQGGPQTIVDTDDWTDDL